MKAYPLTFQPLYKTRIWGGRRLQEVFDKDLPLGETIGESWELVDLPQDQSVVASGPWAGHSLAGLLKDQGAIIMGPVDYSGGFPLLIKLLDAQDSLSVQVHPDEETCRRTGKGAPKTECWYIVDAKPGAFIYKGLRPGCTPAEFTQAISTGTVESLLQKVPVHIGECHFLPSGTVHAIGAGLLIAEIQMPSDTTYRVFDFNRRDASGQTRELHVEDALESIHFDQTPEDLPVTTMARLVDSDVFKVDKGHQLSGSQLLVSPGKMQVMLLLNGQAKITGEFDSFTLTPGSCMLLPAICTAVVQFEQESEYLMASV